MYRIMHSLADQIYVIVNRRNQELPVITKIQELHVLPDALSKYMLFLKQHSYYQ